MGVSCTVDLSDGNPTREQTALFAEMIRSLRNLPTEFLIFDFMYAGDRPGRQQGMVFCQMCRKGKRIRAEIRMDGPEEWRLYAMSLETDEAVKLLRKLIRTRTAPDLSGWEDITETAFPDDSEFE